MKCIACGQRLNGNLDPELCIRCVYARARWEDAASWLPLAKQRIADLEAELDQERARGANMRLHIVNLAHSFETRVIAMQAAVIETRNTDAAQGMRWIANTLTGPGLLPDVSAGAPDAGGAQSWFDAELAIEEARFEAALAQNERRDV